MAEELERLGWRAGELERRDKSDPAKLALAVRPRREIPLTMKWRFSLWREEW
jgi:hypothetical protein